MCYVFTFFLVCGVPVVMLLGGFVVFCFLGVCFCCVFSGYYILLSLCEFVDVIQDAKGFLDINAVQHSKSKKLCFIYSFII